MSDKYSLTEFTQLFRYAIPGIVSILLLLLTLWISNPEFAYLIKSPNDTVGLLSAFLGIFIASGGLGYIYATIYFAIFWRNILSFVGRDHRPLLISLLASNKIRILDHHGNAKTIDDIAQGDSLIAWTIVVEYWQSTKYQNKSLASVDSTIARLVNFTHSLGATLIGLICSFAVWLFVQVVTPYNYAAKSIRDTMQILDQIVNSPIGADTLLFKLIPIVIFGVVIVAIYLNYKDVARQLIILYESSFVRNIEENLQKHYFKRQRPITLYYVDNCRK